MVAMTTAEPWPAAGQLFTVDDLERMPDDGRRYELIDGVLVVSPAPRIPHQEVLARHRRKAVPRRAAVLGRGDSGEPGGRPAAGLTRDRPRSACCNSGGQMGIVGDA